MTDTEKTVATENQPSISINDKTIEALIIVLIGYMIWDRKTAQQPLKQRVTSVEETLDLNNPSGPNVNRLIIALRKRAETDETLAGALRNCSLM